MDNPLLQAIRTYMLTQTAVTNLVGTRIYPLRLPQRQNFDAISPAITMRTISSEHVHTLDGAAGMARPRLQIDCWSRTYLECHQLAEAVRLALQGWSGTSAGLTIHVATLDSRADFVEPPKDGSDAAVYHVALDFFVMQAEAVPEF